ncbi:PolC-type DNA polymerase III [Thermodesulfobacteriota bacterium]
MKRLLRWLRPELHPVIKANQERFVDLDWTGPLEGCEFVSVDTELTGLNPRVDEIVSIGAVRIRNMRIVAGENFLAYVKPKRELPRDSTLIHRITPEQIKSAPPLSEVLPQFIEWCGSALLVGHYVGLDMSFLNKAARGLLGGPLGNPCVDTMKLAQAFQEQLWRDYYDRFNLGVSLNLTALARRFGLPRFDQHDALEDAFQTACLFIFLVKRMMASGCGNLKELYQSGRIGTRIFT